MNQWFARWHLPASHQGYRRQTYLLDLYERPGILRGRAHLPRSEIQPSCLFAPNGRDIIVSIWYTVLLYHR